MQHSDVRRVMEAVGNRTLPLRPGDVLLFTISNERMFIVCSTTQEKHPQEGQAGQHIAGIRSKDGRWWWEPYLWLSWDGVDRLWTIHRTS